MPDLVYIADDEPNIRKLAALALKDSGFETQEFADGVSLMAAVRVRKPDAIVLDWMMPPPDGLAVCHKIRADESTRPIPILMLTARGEEVDRVLGLEMGADDYITKPFNPVEVIARVKSQLRRYMQLGSGQIKKDAIVIGGIELNDNSKQVTVDGELVSLTPTEYDILRLLMEHPGQVFSPRDIYKEVWKETPLGAEGSVAVHIRHLREKIEINPGEPRYIKVIWGRGYKMEYQ